MTGTEQMASDIIEKFSILLVEDKPRAVEDQIKEIEAYITKKGLGLELVESTTGEDVSEILRASNIDIVVTDKNITEDTDGIAVVKMVRDSGFWTDILFYSAKGFDPKTVHQQMDYYGFVEVVEGKEFAEPLKRIVDKNLRRWNDIAYLRGALITKVIDLELKLNVLYSKYFKIPEESMCNFHDFILENRSNTLEGKIATLNSILRNSNLIKLEPFKSLPDDLHDLQRNRNYLAHCKRDPQNPNCLVSMGQPKEFTKKKIIKLFAQAREASKVIDLLDSKLFQSAPVK